MDEPNPFSKFSFGTFSSIIFGTTVKMIPAQMPCENLLKMVSQKYVDIYPGHIKMAIPTL